MMTKIFNWFKNIFFPSNRLSLVFVSEFPKKLKKHRVYIEGNSGIHEFWYAKLICPCGCSSTLTLNLINDVTPCWEIINNQDSKTFSLYPSIRKTSECKSHFWIVDSKVKWCKD